jgi:GNAT superfamily N-acetyltransferase
MLSSQITIIDFDAAYALETVKMWRQSFQRAMGLEEHDRFSELEGQLKYFMGLDSSISKVAMDQACSKIVGLMTRSHEELLHLFVHVEHQGFGIGSRLLAAAKTLSPNGLTLYTFDKNSKAQLFYLSHGFVEVGRGYADFAGNPWARSKEELADVQSLWRG